MVNSFDASYWTTLAIVFVPAGAFLKYLVWDFFHMPERLHVRFSTPIAEAHASIHERRFLPTLVQVYDQIASRKTLLPSASTMDILTELRIDAQLREAAAAISERNALDTAFQRAIGLCPWIAVSWLIVVSSSLGLFLIYPMNASAWRPRAVQSLIAIIIIGSLMGMTGFGFFVRARNRMVRIVGANRF